MEQEQMTPEAMLAEVNKAIYAICAGGQSYRIGSRQLNRADLKTLYDMKNSLAGQAASGEQGLLDNCYVAVFDQR